MKLALPKLALLVLALAACTGERAADGADNAPVATAADRSAEDVPPATPPPRTTPPPHPTPADGAISYAGFGPAQFGADAEAVRMAWGKDLQAGTPSEAGGCYYLFPQPRALAGNGVGFMIEDDKFSRIDVDSTDIVAPGGGRTGMTADEIRKRYAGRIEEQNHKYVEGGKTLRIKDSAGGNGVLVFATDGAGTVTQWRIGLPPQVDYVEGCS